MGDILKGLGLGAGPPQVDPIASLRASVINPQASAPVDPLAPLPEQGQPELTASPPDQGPNMADIVVTGDNWKPRGQTFLGALADGYLMSNGMKPGFADNRDKRNIQEALGGYGQDPQEALRRLSRIPGHEMDAIKLYGQRADDTRADSVAKRQADVANERYLDRIGGMYGAATPENFNKVDDMARRYAVAHGIDPDEVGMPSSYDPDAINAFRMGAIDPKSQAQLSDMRSYRDQRLSQFDRSQNSTDSYHNQRLDQFNRGSDEDLRHNVTMEKIAEGREARLSGGGKSAVMYDGKKIGEVSPSGAYAVVTVGNQVRVYNVVNGKLHGRVPKLEEKYNN